MSKDDKKAPPVAAEEEKKDVPVVAQKANLSEVDYGEDAGAGFENQSKDDTAVPFIDILQPGSPEVQDQPEGGARAGMIINRTTGEVFEGKNKGIVFIPAITEHCYTEWKPKKGPNGELLKGGFVARHELTEQICQTARTESPFKAHRLPNGNDLIETFYVPALILDEDTGGFAPAMLAFTSTKIKSYKAFSYISRAIMVKKPGGGMQNPPIFSHKYRFTTQMKKEGQNTWYIPVIGFETPNNAEASRLAPSDQLYQAAKGLKQAMTSGAVKVDYTKTGNDDVVSAAGEKPPF